MEVGLSGRDTCESGHNNRKPALLQEKEVAVANNSKRMKNADEPTKLHEYQERRMQYVS